jgi:predicted phosphoribosyltransferase
MGAIASGGVRVLNADVIESAGVGPDDVEAVTQIEMRELLRREQLYRDGREPLDVRGHVVVLVDDGLATGATMRAGVTALRERDAGKIVVAVPAGPPRSCREFEEVADEVVCALMPEPFRSVGLWYRDFAATTDAEVRELLAQARSVYSAFPPRP